MCPQLSKCVFAARSPWGTSGRFAIEVTEMPQSSPPPLSDSWGADNVSNQLMCTTLGKHGVEEPQGVSRLSFNTRPMRPDVLAIQSLKNQHHRPPRRLARFVCDLRSLATVRVAVHGAGRGQQELERRCVTHERRSEYYTVFQLRVPRSFDALHK